MPELAACRITIAFGRIVSGLFSLEGRLGILTSGAVAICGASAALAIAAVLPKSETSERDTAFTVIGVTTLSTIAMVIYPILIPLFRMDHVSAGIFLGGTIPAADWPELFALGVKKIYTSEMALADVIKSLAETLK